MPTTVHPPLDSTAENWGPALVALGRRAVASSNIELLMHDAAAMLAESLDADVSGVAELVDDGANLAFELTPNRDGVELDVTKHSATSAADQSLAGFALADGHPVGIADLTLEARFTDRFLLDQQLRSAVACPLKTRERAYGALLIGKRTSQEFAEQDMLFVEAIGHLITNSIARERAEEALSEQLRLDAAMLDTVDALVLVLDPELRILQFNRACAEVSGFTLPELRQRGFCGAFLAVGEVRDVRQELERLPRQTTPVEFEACLLTKLGVRRRIAWAFTCLRAANGNVDALVGTGIDITERCELEVRLEQLRTAAGDASRQLAQAAEPTTTKPVVAKPAVASPAPTSPNPVDAERARPFQVLTDGLFSDRRSRPRRAYPYAQLMAPITDGRLPSIREFAEVQCRDIGAGGFSYFAAIPPAQPDLVVAFGTGDSQTYLTARVIHLSPTTRDGQPAFIIGCRYTGRTAYEE